MGIIVDSPSSLFVAAAFIAFFMLETAKAEECQSTAGLKASIVEENAEECAVEAVGTMLAFKVVGGKKDKTPSTEFYLGERVVLCVRPPINGYISVWDAPPNGDRERLFPNSISHPEGEKGQFLKKANSICIGEVGSGYAVEISDHEGTGLGQFYLLITDSIEAQLDANSFNVPSFGFSASIRGETEIPVEDLEGYSDTWLIYRVRD